MVKINRAGKFSETHAAYYQKTADVIAIWWASHKERMRTGNLPFALVEDREKGTAATFDPHNIVENGRGYGAFPRYPMIRLFANAATSTLGASWAHFSLENGRHGKASYLSRTSTPDCVRSYMHPYVEQLLYEAECLGQQDSPIRQDDLTYSLTQTVKLGISTGIHTIAQLKGIFGDDFRVLHPIVLSKLSLRTSNIAGSEIGLLENPKNKKTGAQPHYELLDHTRFGLNSDRLRELGRGSVLGCPASLPVSEETQQFLKERGAYTPGVTMLEELASVTAVEFDSTIVRWYEGLSELQRSMYLDPENDRILGGEVRRDANAESRGCPHGKER